MKSDEEIIEVIEARVNLSDATKRVVLHALNHRENEWKKELEELQKDLVYNLIGVPTSELKDTITKTFYKRFGL